MFFETQCIITARDMYMLWYYYTGIIDINLLYYIIYIYIYFFYYFLLYYIILYYIIIIIIINYLG